MKVHDKLEEILESPGQLRILRFLYQSPSEHTGRFIAKAVKMSASGAYEIIKKLESKGFLKVTRQGQSCLYQLDHNHYVVKKFLGVLFAREKNIYQDIISLIKKGLSKAGDCVCAAALFGSVVSKQETALSDIDLVIILNDAKKKRFIEDLTNTLNLKFASDFHASLEPYILTQQEFRKKFRQKIKLIQNIVSQNRLILGEPLERIVA